MITEDSQVCLQLLVDLFCLSVCLWVESCREVCFNAQVFVYGTHDFGGVQRASVRYNLERESMQVEHMIDVNVGLVLGGHPHCARVEVGHLGAVVLYHNDGVIPV